MARDALPHAARADAAHTLSTDARHAKDMVRRGKSDVTDECAFARSAYAGFKVDARAKMRERSLRKVSAATKSEAA